MEIDRELLLQLVTAVSDQIYALSAKLEAEAQEHHDKLTLLELRLQQQRFFADERFRESLERQTSAARESQHAAAQRFHEANRRVEQMKMILQGKSLREIDARFEAQDKQHEERRRELIGAFKLDPSDCADLL
jgi:hypothetical protein